MTDHLERNKANAIAFHDMMFNQSRPAEAIKHYAGRLTQGRGVDIRNVNESTGMGSVVGGRPLASGCLGLGVGV